MKSRKEGREGGDLHTYRENRCKGLLKNVQAPNPVQERIRDQKPGKGKEGPSQGIHFHEGERRENEK